MSLRALHKNPLHNVKVFVSKSVNYTMSVNNGRHCLQSHHPGKKKKSVIQPSEDHAVLEEYSMNNNYNLKVLMRVYDISTVV